MEFHTGEYKKKKLNPFSSHSGETILMTALHEDQLMFAALPCTHVQVLSHWVVLFTYSFISA